MLLQALIHAAVLVYTSIHPTNDCWLLHAWYGGTSPQSGGHCWHAQLMAQLSVYLPQLYNCLAQDTLVHIPWRGSFQKQPTVLYYASYLKDACKTAGDLIISTIAIISLLPWHTSVLVMRACMAWVLFWACTLYACVDKSLFLVSSFLA